MNNNILLKLTHLVVLYIDTALCSKSSNFHNRLSTGQKGQRKTQSDAFLDAYIVSLINREIHDF